MWDTGRKEALARQPMSRLTQEIDWKTCVRELENMPGAMVGPPKAPGFMTVGEKYAFANVPTVKLMGTVKVPGCPHDFYVGALRQKFNLVRLLLRARLGHPHHQCVAAGFCPLLSCTTAHARWPEMRPLLFQRFVAIGHQHRQDSA